MYALEIEPKPRSAAEVHTTSDSGSTELCRPRKTLPCLPALPADSAPGCGKQHGPGRPLSYHDAITGLLRATSLPLRPRYCAWLALNTAYPSAKPTSALQNGQRQAFSCVNETCSSSSSPTSCHPGLSRGIWHRFAAPGHATDYYNGPTALSHLFTVNISLQGLPGAKYYRCLTAPDRVRAWFV